MTSPQKIITVALLAVAILNNCSPKDENNKMIIGKWRMMERKYDCPTRESIAKYNSSPELTDTQWVYTFDPSEVQISGNSLDTSPDTRVKYKFENDTIILNYQSKYPETKAYAHFSTSDKLTLKQPLIDSKCILIATFKRIK